VELLERYRQLVRSTISRYNGAEIRTEGDSFYVCSHRRAARSRAQWRSSLPQPAPSRRSLSALVFHAGEAADTGEGPVGSAVNIAARVCSALAAGEVLVTETVRAVTRTVLPYRYVPRGTPTLKGITEPIPLFSVISADASSTAATPRRWSAGVRSGALLGLMLVFGILLIGLIATSLNLFGASLVTPTPAAPTIQPGQTAAPPSPSPSQLPPRPRRRRRRRWCPLKPSCSLVSRADCTGTRDLQVGDRGRAVSRRDHQRDLRLRRRRRCLTAPSRGVRRAGADADRVQSARYGP
jgi:hypothetical protein